MFLYIVSWPGVAGVASRDARKSVSAYTVPPVMRGDRSYSRRSQSPICPLMAGHAHNRLSDKCLTAYCICVYLSAEPIGWAYPISWFRCRRFRASCRRPACGSRPFRGPLAVVAYECEVGALDAQLRRSSSVPVAARSSRMRADGGCRARAMPPDRCRRAARSFAGAVAAVGHVDGKASACRRP